MRQRLPILLILVLFVTSCAETPRHAASGTGHTPLILVSIDGFRADYLERGLTPTLQRLAADGVRASAMKPAFPTLTFPNHYTIVTGLYPDHHGIVDNRFRDPVTGARFVYKDPELIADPTWWGGEPIWVGAEKQGLHAATVFWPGSDVTIDGVRPSQWMRFDSTVTPAARVDQLLRWFDEPAPKRATFFTLYFEQVDHAGHQGGPDSAGVDAALRKVDAALARLVAGLRQRHRFDSTNIIVLSDHGATATSPERVVYLDDLVGDSDAELINSGILASLAPKAGHTAKVEAALLKPHDHMRCWRKSDVPARLHYGSNPRIPPLLCLADDGWVISTHERMDKRTHFSLGEHGYDNDDPAMRALFIARGPSFRHGLVVPEFDNVDVYPLMTHLLGIHAYPNDGDFSAVAGMLAPGQ